MFAVHEWKAAFKADLEGRAGLADVRVYDAESNLEDTAREAIVLGDFEIEVGRLTFTKDTETTTVACSIRVWHPASATDARDRAIAILREVYSETRSDPQASSSAFDSQMSAVSGEEAIWPENGRVCTLEFNIDVEYNEP